MSLKGNNSEMSIHAAQPFQHEDWRSI